MPPYVPPVYVLDPARAWPEVPPEPQSTADAQRAVTGITMAVAYWLSGAEFRGTLADLTPEKFLDEIKGFADENMLEVDTIFKWAESILLPVDATLSPSEMLAVPSYMPSFGFRAHDFQRDTAAWSARRAGSVLALSCGTGKTFTAYAAAVAAARLKRLRATRCYIVAPLIAGPAWEPYVPLFKQEFEEVHIISVDSAHKWRNIQRLGGALIIDECHTVKDGTSRRTQSTFDMRLGFDWCVGMTGTLLHAGPGGVVAIQDIACPGLSRFPNLWNFGHAFNCVYEKQVNNRKRRAIGMPGEADFGRFVAYLNRGVKSLSFASPAVAAAVRLPGQTCTLVDTWEKPAWIRMRQLAEHSRADTPLAFDDWLEQGKSNCIWLPEVRLSEAFAYLALAVQTEMQEDHEDQMEIDPEFAAQFGEHAGLPTFPKILMAACREGRYDRVIERATDENGMACYRFVYAPGSSREKPKPGVKVQFVERWINDHPDEPAVLSAQSTGAKEMLMQVVGDRPYHVIDGDTPKKSRGSMIADFQEGRVQYMIVQQQAGSVSMTLTRAATSFLVDHAWSALLYDQFLARTNRTGQTRECEHFDLVFGLAQMKVLASLSRGCSFDARVRAELENIYNLTPLGRAV